MTGMQYADVLRDAAMLSGGAPAYAWVRAMKTARGVPIGVAAAQAAKAAGQEGLLAVWLHGCALAFCGRYTVCAAEFARAADDAADTLCKSGAVLFPTAVRLARDAQSFADWSTAAYAGGLRAAGTAHTDEQVFLPWLCAMYARYL